MADNKYNVELDNTFISKLYELTESLPPDAADINLENLKNQLLKVASLVENLKNDTGKTGSENKNAGEQTQSSLAEEDSSSSDTIDLANFTTDVSNVKKASEFAQLGISMNYGLSTLQFIEPADIKRTKKQYFDDNGKPVKGKVLVIDDLGIITYQLGVIFKRAGYLPVTSKEVYEAIDKYKQSSFDYVIMDLFIPTEREGFILLEELRKISLARNEEPVIAIMSASTKKQYKKVCHEKGAAFYVEKVDDWQKELFALLLQYN